MRVLRQAGQAQPARPLPPSLRLRARREPPPLRCVGAGPRRRRPPPHRRDDTRLVLVLARTPATQGPELTASAEPAPGPFSPSDLGSGNCIDTRVSCGVGSRPSTLVGLLPSRSEGDVSSSSGPRLPPPRAPVAGGVPFPLAPKRGARDASGLGAMRPRGRGCRRWRCSGAFGITTAALRVVSRANSTHPAGSSAWRSRTSTLIRLLRNRP